MIRSLMDYQKLEKVEVGGLMGRWYSPMIEGVYYQFSKYMERMISISYDPLNILNDMSNNLFLEDYRFYLSMSEDIDNRLASISKACFENSNDLMSIHKVMIYLFNINIVFILSMKQKLIFQLIICIIFWTLILK